MSHRKACSQWSIPFSWEDSPGVSKTKIHRRCHDDDEGSPPPPPSGRRSMEARESDHGTLLPPPPPSSCTKLQRHLRGSSSGKTSSFGRCQLEDPFLAAYKECTKDRFRWWKKTAKNYGSNGNGKKLMSSDQSKKVVDGRFFSSNTGNCNYGSDCKGRKSSKFVFSCNSSCDVVESSLVARLANLPHLPDDHRVRRR
ncbi:unnamed protein product [Linum trigynum]|uniref:Uncharacterized protein n=1 Tax=Linum trigynum TaxID=586398 RepID=A0AAV2E4X5_9ROSI